MDALITVLLACLAFLLILRVIIKFSKLLLFLGIIVLIVVAYFILFPNIAL